MSGQHTPEPWFAVANQIHDRLTTFDEHGSRTGSTPNIIAQAFTMPIADETAAENVARIVACVNACAGITNERLGDLTRRGESPMQRMSRLYDEADSAADKISRLTEQRDELLAACRLIVKQFGGYPPATNDGPLSAARAAIAKVGAA